MSLKNFFGRVLGVCIISLAASAVFTAGAFAAGSTYKISATATEYNVKNNGFLGSTNYSNEGVRLIFVAPTTGTYTINFQTDAPDKEFKIIKTDSSYNANFLTTYFYSTFKDSVAVNAGDSLFYKVNNYWYADTLENFKVSYSTLTATTKNLTVTSASKIATPAAPPAKWSSAQSRLFSDTGKRGTAPPVGNTLPIPFAHTITSPISLAPISTGTQSWNSSANPAKFTTSPPSVLATTPTAIFMTSSQKTAYDSATSSQTRTST